MQRVKDLDPDQFEDISNILARYKTLEERREALVSENRRKEKIFEELKESITKYQKEGEERKLDLTNQVQILMNEKEKIIA